MTGGRAADHIRGRFLCSMGGIGPRLALVLHVISAVLLVTWTLPLATPPLVSAAGASSDAASSAPRPSPTPAPPPPSPYEVCVVGGGPAGLQLGMYLQRAQVSYVLLEQAPQVAAFFTHYPRSRQLISLNRRHILGGFEHSREFHLRHDWHSLLFGNSCTPHLVSVVCVVVAAVLPSPSPTTPPPLPQRQRRAGGAHAKPHTGAVSPC